MRSSGVVDAKRKIVGAAAVEQAVSAGVDVPEVVNPVFFAPVRSTTTYRETIGRGRP
ncbi:hypothetical protein [Streptomyces macrosporus]|uniref:hypothetical protein n=1 Tax=Streptomyces macrosporus TaxID=44032 RepID=UPI0031CF1B70